MSFAFQFLKRLLVFQAFFFYTALHHYLNGVIRFAGNNACHHIAIF